MLRRILCLVLALLPAPALARTPKPPHGIIAIIGHRHDDLFAELDAHGIDSPLGHNIGDAPFALGQLPVKGPFAGKVDKVLRAHPRPADHPKAVYTAPMATGAGYTVSALDGRGEAPLHTHHLRSEILYVTAGQALFRLAGQTYKVGPGAVLVIPQDVPHGFSAPKKLLGLIVAVGTVDPADLILVPAPGAK